LFTSKKLLKKVAQRQMELYQVTPKPKTIQQLSQFLTFSVKGKVRKLNFLKKERNEKEKVRKLGLIDSITSFV